MHRTTTMTLLEQREIEAKIVGPLFAAFAEEIGEARAMEVLRGVIEKLAKQGGEMAAQSVGGTSIPHLEHAMENWNQGDTLSLTILRQDDDHYDFNVTRCEFAEMYKRMGMEKLGEVLSCGRDGHMIDGFNADIEFSRTQTIMEGERYCDFRYRVKRAKETTAATDE